MWSGCDRCGPGGEERLASQCIVLVTPCFPTPFLGPPHTHSQPSGTLGDVQTAHLRVLFQLFSEGLDQDITTRHGRAKWASQGFPAEARFCPRTFGASSSRGASSSAFATASLSLFPTA